MKKILLLGSGGREYTMAWKISQSTITHQLFIAPGNGGTHAFGTNLPFGYNDFDSIIGFARKHSIDLVIAGPEEPLVNGIADRLSTEGILVCGPVAQAAMLEGSKSFAKDFMQAMGIPTAAYRAFESRQIDEARQFLHTLTPPYVLKADGLAAGKGVVICHTLTEATDTLDAMLLGEQFGQAGRRVVIEEFLSGIEFSVFIATDGAHYVLLPEAKDYKRIGEGDTGPNTGGMGAISPVPFFNESLRHKVITRIIEPTLQGLRQRQIPYRGFIFFGLISVAGEPYLIEYNCRLGDPETEVILPRLDEDFLQLCFDIANGQLGSSRTALATAQAAATVMVVSGGYPSTYQRGFPITLPDTLPRDTHIINAGTNRQANLLTTSGGRVLAVTSLAPDIRQALQLSYSTIEHITFEQMYYRRDIGYEFL
ncbi:phosphoribosylamine--glycine ligase [Schleiferia thermophila]|uniref:Phosphoribosylamine--glycine ligase n=1 Tax=Schleiferia thermophila TaxID=884107 RepID=A0A369A8B9_9FLAO|nr:phosphoribosylamine--glycine ligase [Schleiferia thermophila]RCX03674.1 phosphoribosylamine--glycine ligase [Schleiferia thermophila]GCD79909.1 phosphoribosylamine--glycine ligase [Schleiferia thermophila]